MWPDTEFSTIQYDNQFLLFYLHRDQIWENHLWFWGGRDGDEVFFRRVYVNAMNAFRHGSEKEFFEALVPPKVRLFQKRTRSGVERCGLLFACPTGLNWEEVEIMTRAFVSQGPQIRTVRNEQVFDTNNKITGRYMELFTVQHHWWAIGEGEVTGPCGSLILKEPCVMQRLMQWG